MDDLFQSIESPYLAYAEDVKIWSKATSSIELDPLLQKDLDRLHLWSLRWQLPLNTSKCKHLHIGSGVDASEFRIDGHLLQMSSSERDLGVIATSDFRTAEHTAGVCSSARGILRAIRWSFSKLTPKALTTLFASHVRPRSEYGDSATYPCSSTEMDR